MATKADIYPLQQRVDVMEPKVESHEKIKNRGINALVCIGVATLVAAIFSPHYQALKQILLSALK